MLAPETDLCFEVTVLTRRYPRIRYSYLGSFRACRIRTRFF